MHRTLFLALIISIIISSAAWGASPHHAWSQRFGSNLNDQAVAVAFDDYGNLYAAGYFQGSVDFGGGALVSAGGFDIFLAKYAPDGSHLWSQKLGGPSSAYVLSLAVDRYGFVSLTGHFAGTADFGGGGITSTGFSDMYVARFDPAGTHLWSLAIGGSNDDVGTGVAMDHLGNTFVTGYYQDNLTVDSITYTSNGGFDILLVKFDINGNVDWSHSFGGISDDYAKEVTVDGEGSAILVADAYSSIDFGGGLVTNQGALDIYLAKFNSAGAFQWSKGIGGGSSDNSSSLAVDSRDNIILTGYFYGTVDLGGGNLSSQGSTDILLVKYDAGGVHQWSNSYGGTDADVGLGVAVDASDHVYLVGQFSATASFGGTSFESLGKRDIVVARYGSDGLHNWSSAFGGMDSDEARKIAVDAAGNVAIFADYINVIDFGGGPLFSAGSSDLALVKFHQGPDIHSVQDVPGDQGGLVNVAWDANSGDNADDQAITDYTVWRAISSAAATAMVDNGAVLIDDAVMVKSAAIEQPIVRAAGNYYWFQVATVNAIALENYSAPVATMYDSTGASRDPHYFQVIAHTVDPYVYYTSSPDSGFSIDNLAPSAPQGLTAEQKMGPDGLDLTWRSNTEEDLSHYEVYRGINPGFIADEGSFLSESADTSVFDTGWTWDGGYWYKVFAVDIHGNMSSYNMIGPDLVSSVGENVPGASRLEQNIPNPFNPNTTIAFTLKQADHVSLHIFDAKGQLVRTLVDGHRNASTHTATWDGRDDMGVGVASGVYFYRLTAGAFMQTKKMVMLK